MIEPLPRVLYVNPASERGGGEVIMLNVLRRLPALGWQGEVALLGHGPLEENLHSLAVPTHVVPAGRFREPHAVLRTVHRLKRLIVARGISVVDSAGAKGHVYGGLAAWRAGVPAVWRMQDFPLRLDQWLRLAAPIPARRILTYSEATCVAFRRLRSEVPSLRVIYPGVDIATLTGGVERGAVRDELRLPAATALVTILGRLQRWKGQDVFLRAAAVVLAERHDVHFLVVGGALFGLDSDYPDELRRLAAELGITPNVTFLGQRSDVGAILEATDLLVHASTLPEPFGQVIVEGMVLGKAVIATAAGGPLEIIQDGVDGLLVPPGDPTSLAKAVLDLLDNPGRRARLGAAAAGRARTAFSADAMAEQFVRCYEEVTWQGRNVRE